jgi:hypothetical protein
MRTITLECEGDTFCFDCAPSDATLTPIFSVEDWRFWQSGCDVLACMRCHATLDVMHDDMCEHVTDAVSPRQLYEDCIFIDT